MRIIVFLRSQHPEFVFINEITERIVLLLHPINHADFLKIQFECTHCDKVFTLCVMLFYKRCYVVMVQKLELIYFDNNYILVLLMFLC